MGDTIITTHTLDRKGALNLLWFSLGILIFGKGNISFQQDLKKLILDIQSAVRNEP